MTAELVTLEYLWWWNNTRPHQGLGHHTPTEDEATYYPGLESTQPALAEQGTKQKRNPGRFTSMLTRLHPSQESEPQTHQGSSASR